VLAAGAGKNNRQLAPGRSQDTMFNTKCGEPKLDEPPSKDE